MSTLIVTDVTDVPVLLSAGDTLFVAEGGAIFADVSAAVSGAGTIWMTVLGTIASSRNDAVNIVEPAGVDVNIGATGFVSSNIDSAFEIEALDFSLRNAGTITAPTYAVDYTSETSIAGWARITNTGTMLGSIRATFDPLLGGEFHLINSGNLLSASGIMVIDVVGASEIHLLNTGVIGRTDSGLEGLRLTGTIAYVDNQGEINASINLNGFATYFVNTGTVKGSISGSNGHDSFDTRHGVVTGTLSGGAGDDLYAVSDSDQSISEAMYPNNDTSRDTVLSTVSFTLGFGLEVLRLRGADALVGIGNDRDNYLEGSQANNLLHGRSGNDTFFTNGSGRDTLRGGSGNDTLHVMDGDDCLLVGGEGTDLLRIESPAAVLVRFGTGRATGVETGNHSFTSIEQVRTYLGNDTILGSVGAERMEARQGNDSLSGGGGADTLVGGLGRDVLTGGGGADFFLFTALAETPADATTRDVITDFNDLLDVIDLAAFDFLAGPPDLAFAFSGTLGFSNKPMQLRYQQMVALNLTVVEGDVTGDGVADFQIELTGLHTLTATHFIL